MKAGDLVRVFEPRACGGLPEGAIGLVLSEDNSQPKTPRWTIMWLFNNNVWGDLKMSESKTYGHGVEVINYGK